VKLLCKISGVEYQSSTYFDNEPIFPDTHPVFRLPARTLLAKAKKWGSGNYSEQEEKLLFLSLLNATGAVIWEVPAEPEHQTVLKNMESVFKLLAWYTEVSAGTLKLPVYRVSSYNYTLSNIGTFVSSWYEVRKAWMSPGSRKLLEDILEQREFMLTKLIHSQKGQNTEAYAKRLASWAMDAGRVEDTPEYPQKRKIWTDLFLLKLGSSELFSCDLDELLDLRDHMEKELYAVGSIGAGYGSLYSSKVLEHLEKLVTQRKGGYIAYLGGEVGGAAGTFSISSQEEVESSWELEAEGRSSSETGEEILRLEKLLADSGCPSSYPKKENYPGKLSDWIRANASWTLNSESREKLAFLRGLRKESDERIVA
jgi:hypothetical protein